MATITPLPMSKVALPYDHLAKFCQKWNIAQLAAFGSILRDDCRPDSDVDLLYTFAPDSEWSLFDVIGIEQELRALLGRPVDLVSTSALERSQNWIRRKEILSTARTIYAA